MCSVDTVCMHHRVLSSSPELLSILGKKAGEVLEDYDNTLEALYSQVDGEDQELTTSSREHTPVRGRLSDSLSVCRLV